MRLPNFDAMMPVAQGVTEVISTAPSRFNTQFGIVFEGQIWIPSTGQYTFFLRSDDGSQLKIDGATLVNNDGLHGLREKAGSVTLTQGFHTIRIDYFQLLGGNGLSLQWQGPGVSRRKFPERGVLFYSPDRK